MTMKAAVVNLGNCTGDKLFVEHTKSGETTPTTVALRRGQSVEVDVPHGREDHPPVKLRASDSRGSHVDHPQMILVDRPAQVG